MDELTTMPTKTASVLTALLLTGVYEVALIGISVFVLSRNLARESAKHSGDFLNTISIPAWWWLLVAAGPIVACVVWIRRPAGS